MDVSRLSIFMWRSREGQDVTNRTGCDNIRLLRKFDERLLQQHPSEYLRLEDQRLQDLNDLTKQMWEIKKRHGGDPTEG